MAGETSLSALLASMEPTLNPGCYVFATVSEPPDDVRPVVTVVEPEGLTLVLTREEADRAHLAYDYLAGWITLRVHSALAAVGLTAAVAGALAEASISCNMVAGYHHDHLFVPYEQTAQALAVLAELAGSVRKRKKNTPRGHGVL